MSSDTPTTVGDYLVKRLEHAGIRHVFSVPGDYVLSLMDRVVASPVELVGMCNELNAGYAADAYARLAGIGAVMVTYDVGGLSLLNAVAGAEAERVGLVVISGAPRSDHHRRAAPMHHLAGDYRVQHDIFHRITAYAAMLMNPETAPREIDHALEVCLTQRRPVYIEVPVDMVEEPCEAPAGPLHRGVPTSDAGALAESVEETVTMLETAARPAILVGVETHRFGLYDDVLALLNQSGYPVATTLNGKTAVAEDHPQFIGVYQGAVSRPEIREVIEGADCLLSLGAWFNDIATGMFTAQLDPQRMVTANFNKMRIRHHRFDRVYLGDFITGLTDALRTVPTPAPHPSPPPYATTGPFEAVRDKPLAVQRFFERLNHFMNDDMVLVAGTGDCVFGAAELHVGRYESFVAQAFYLSIGYALPAGLGAALAAPDRRVVVSIGDGAFQMTAQALSSLIRYNVAPIVFILNNDGYAIERAIHDGPYNEIQRWKYHELPAVFGDAYGVAVRTEGELEDALRAASEITDRLVLIEIIVDRHDTTDATRRIGAGSRRLSKGGGVTS